MRFEIKTLGTVAQYINGRAFKPVEWEETGLPIIRIQNLTNPNAKYNYSSAEYEEKYLINNGDLLFAWSASLGAHIWKQGSAWLNQHIFKVIPNNDVDRDYLYYYLLKVVAELYQKAHGTGMVHITKVPFMATTIPIPDLDTQRKIVYHIEESLSQLDSAVETLKKTKQQLEVYRQAVLKEAFEGLLTHSEKIKDDELINYIEKPRYGTSKKCTYSNSESMIPVYRIPNIEIKQMRIDKDDIKFAAFAESELDPIRLVKDDILIIRSNGSASLVGRAAIIYQSDTDATFAGYLIRLRITNKIKLSPKYLLWYLQSSKARAYIEGKAKSTSGVHNINSTEISSLDLPIFEIDEQNKIVEAIESRISVYDTIEQTVNQSLQQAEALRQSILKQAFEEE